jgi:hypothetical protein
MKCHQRGPGMTIMTEKRLTKAPESLPQMSLKQWMILRSDIGSIMGAFGPGPNMRIVQQGKLLQIITSFLSKYQMEQLHNGR